MQARHRVMALMLAIEAFNQMRTATTRWANSDWK
jgi:hypothetical protein